MASGAGGGEDSSKLVYMLFSLKHVVVAVMLPLLCLDTPTMTSVLGFRRRVSCRVLVMVRVSLTVGTTFLAW